MSTSRRSGTNKRTTRAAGGGGEGRSKRGETLAALADVSNTHHAQKKADKPVSCRGKRNDDDSLFSPSSDKAFNQALKASQDNKNVQRFGSDDEDLSVRIPHPATLPPTVMKTALSWRTMDSYSLRQASPYVRKVIV